MTAWWDPTSREEDDEEHGNEDTTDGANAIVTHGEGVNGDGSGADSSDGSGRRAGSGERREMAGYYSQEVEGIGGVVKKMIKKRFRVGRTVIEHEDERARNVYLDREAKGVERSWCGWCDRVILGKKDLEAQG